MLHMTNLKGSIFGGANSDSTSLQFAKREDSIDVKYEFIASTMFLCPVSSLSSTINLRVFQKLCGFGLLSSNFSAKYVFLAFLSDELITFHRRLYSDQSNGQLNFLAFL